jgi:CheY-specific phosphatase CheX
MGGNYVAVSATTAVELNHNNSRPKMKTMTSERVWVGVHGNIEGIVIKGNTLEMRLSIWIKEMKGKQMRCMYLCEVHVGGVDVYLSSSKTFSSISRRASISMPWLETV